MKKTSSPAFRRFACIASLPVVFASALAGSAQRVYAQQAAAPVDFPDVPVNHWAYAAVKELADKGFIKGYPDGSFLGRRNLTRYEFALVISRILETIKPAPPVAPALPPPPPPPGVTPDDLNKLQMLLDQFRVDLGALKTDLAAADQEIAQLKLAVTENQAAIKKAQSTADTALDTSYGAGPGRKLTISGFAQLRYTDVDSGNRKLFPDGVGTTNGYNGNYDAGTNRSSFQIREARIAFGGGITQNTRYIVEFGTPGAINATATGTAQTFVRRLYGQYTFGNGDPEKNISLVFGQFWLPFGYLINQPRPTWYTPERGLAFNESPNGLFASQEFDRGLQLSYSPKALTLKAALINGSGATSNDTNVAKDVVAHAAYKFGPSASIGASGYFGKIDTSTSTTAPAAPSTTPNGKKDLYGADFQYASLNRKGGPFLQAEYVAGKYEAIPPATVGSTLPPTGSTIPTASLYLPGNKIEGDYVTGGWTFHPRASNPLSLIASYDTFNRDKDVSTRTDKNFGYGAMYNLDRATRFRLYYIKPSEVSYAPGTAVPPKLGLYTAEFQVRF